MLKARVDGGELVRAVKGSAGVCPGCEEDVRAHCGRIVPPYWSHLAGADCDRWTEPMTAWHCEWQERFPWDCREVVLPPHRADVRSPSGWVLEFQHSALSVDEIEERENFYGHMVWVFDLTGFERGDGRLVLDGNGGQLLWNSPRVSWLKAQKGVYLDTRWGVFRREAQEPWRRNPNSIVMFGTMMEKDDFVKRVMEAV